MKRNSNLAPLPQRGHRSLLVKLVFVLLLGIFAMASLSVQAQNKETLENKVPKHLPIKVEILYGKRAELLENAEIKVTNTGKRPIFFLKFMVSTADSPELSVKYGLGSFYFGRRELITFGNLANSDDPSLKPGESLLFTVSKKRVDAYRKARRDEHQIIPERYELIFQFLNFGDDTGFFGTNGAFRAPKKETPIVNATDLRRPFFFRTAN
ncbi:MAG TPA: hypothetical protein PKD26_03930 [Pyrinomonadaceae bacterium]|nr:hypothetical protein [Pyrinomonadaceae bacterium]